MNKELLQKLSEFRRIRGFNASDWIFKKCTIFNDYLKQNRLSGAVVNLSGGIDSACIFGLLKRAKEMPNSPLKKVLAIAQPIHSTKKIWTRALDLGKAFNEKVITIDQSFVHDILVDDMESELGIKSTKFATGQFRSYMRTPIAYFAAQVLSANGFGTIVVGTGNKDEDGYLRYFCKAGDGVADVQLIADLHKSEVRTVSKELGVIPSIMDAPPSADLWEGQTDENELGFGYDYIELITEYLELSINEQRKFKNSLSKKSLTEFEKVQKEAEQIHKRNAHKANFPIDLNIL